MGQKSTTQKRFHTGETTGVATLTNKKLEKIPKNIHNGKFACILEHQTTNRKCYRKKCPY